MCSKPLSIEALMLSAIQLTWEGIGRDAVSQDTSVYHLILTSRAGYSGIVTSALSAGLCCATLPTSKGYRNDSFYTG